MANVLPLPGKPNNKWEQIGLDLVEATRLLRRSADDLRATGVHLGSAAGTIDKAGAAVERLVEHLKTLAPAETPS